MDSVINGERHVANGEWRGKAVSPSALVGDATCERICQGENGDEALKDMPRREWRRGAKGDTFLFFVFKN